MASRRRGSGPSVVPDRRDHAGGVLPGWTITSVNGEAVSARAIWGALCAYTGGLNALVDAAREAGKPLVITFDTRSRIRQPVQNHYIHTCIQSLGQTDLPDERTSFRLKTYWPQLIDRIT